MTNIGEKNLYLISLPISFRASFPSLRVLVTNQKRNKRNKKAKSIREVFNLNCGKTLYYLKLFYIYFMD